MPFTIAEAQPKTLKNSTMTLPKSLYATNILGKGVEADAGYCVNTSNNSLLALWNNQHPLIHTWLLLSSISICFLSALFFVFP